MSVGRLVAWWKVQLVAFAFPTSECIRRRACSSPTAKTIMRTQATKLLCCTWLLCNCTMFSVVVIFFLVSRQPSFTIIHMWAHLLVNERWWCCRTNQRGLNLDLCFQIIICLGDVQFLRLIWGSLWLFKYHIDLKSIAEGGEVTKIDQPIVFSYPKQQMTYSSSAASSDLHEWETPPRERVIESTTYQMAL